MLEGGPVGEAAALVLSLVPDQLVQLVLLAVVVVILLGLSVVPDLVAIPDSAIIEIAEIGPVAEEWRRRAVAIVGHIDIARLLIAGDALAHLVKMLVPFEILGIHALLGGGGAWGSQVHRHAGIHRVDDVDVGVLQQEGDDRAGLDLA